MASRVQAILEALEAAPDASPDALLDIALSAAARFPATAESPPPAPATAYRAKDGDVLDAIAARVYGDEYAALDVLAANPALAADPHLTAGAMVGLPPVTPRPAEIRTTQIWD